MNELSEEAVNTIIEQLHDLHKQATEERSHYYVGSRTKLAAGVILTPRNGEVAGLVGKGRRGHGLSVC